MSLQLTQSVAANVIVVLSKDSVAVTGLLFSDVSVQFRKEAGSLSVKTLSGANFIEIGAGVYEIQFTASELDTVGSFVVSVTGATIDQSVTVCQVVAATQATSPVSLSMCVINGHVYDATGVPVVGATISAQVIGYPSVEQSVAAVTSGLVSAKTDANGEFVISLIRLADVEITIPLANFRKRLVVPNQATANLYEIP